MNPIPTSLLFRLFAGALLLPLSIASVNAQDRWDNQNRDQTLNGMGAPADPRFQQTFGPMVVATSKVDLLRGKINTAPTEETRLAATEELKAVLAEEFDTMHAEQAKQIQDLVARLEKAESVHRQRLTNKDEIVQRRIEQLIGTPAELQWNVGSSGPPRLQSYPTDSRDPRTPATRFQYYGQRPVQLSSEPVTIRRDQIKPDVQFTVPSDGYATRESSIYEEEFQQESNASSTDIFELARAMARHRIELEDALTSLAESKKRYTEGFPKLNQAEMAVKRLGALVKIDTRQLQSIDEANQRALKTYRDKLKQLRESSDTDPRETQSAEDRVRELERHQEVIQEIQAEAGKSLTPESKPDSKPTLDSPDAKAAPK